MDKSKNILVIGDIILDHYVEGSVTRTSPEAPVLVLNQQKEYFRLGGAANVALNLKALGGTVWIMGRVGEDKYAKQIEHLLCEEGINVDLLIKDSKVPTTVKTRFIAANHHLLRVDQEKTTPLNMTGDYESIIDMDLDRHMRYFDAVVISDYNKGMVFPELIEHIGELNRQYKKILIADTKKENPKLFKNFTCLTPNLKEFKNFYLEPPKEDIKSLLVRGRALIEEINLDHLLITLSERGMLLITRTEATQLFPTKKAVIDVTGCGDTVIAAYTFGLILGYSLKSSAELANQAAGIAVSKSGTSIVSWEELC